MAARTRSDLFRLALSVIFPINTQESKGINSLVTKSVVPMALATRHCSCFRHGSVCHEPHLIISFARKRYIYMQSCSPFLFKLSISVIDR